MIGQVVDLQIYTNAINYLLLSGPALVLKTGAQCFVTITGMSLFQMYTSLYRGVTMMYYENGFRTFYRGTY